MSDIKRVLQVKRKLSDYKARTQAAKPQNHYYDTASEAQTEDTRAGPHHAHNEDETDGRNRIQEASSKGKGYNDASSEIADIDSRLHALQNFLRQAKASSGV